MAPTHQKRPAFSTVKSACRMRFNKSEVTALASQPSHKFEKEGVLFVRERQEGFFRRTEISVERWCRLRGNLLFYFKSRDHFSDPAGLIVVEDCQVEIESNDMESTFGIILTFSGGLQQHLATYTEHERDSWTAALRSASYSTTRSHLESLKDRLRSKLLGNPAATAALSSATIAALDTVVLKDTLTSAAAPTKKIAAMDPSEAPLVEVALSCDNLLCDALGRAPSAKLVLHVRNPLELAWRRFAQTETADKSSNPGFLCTIQFRASEGVCDKTEVRITAYDFREKLTSTCTQLGRAHINVEQLKTSDRTRLKLESPNPEGRTAGFVTLTSWTFEAKLPGSTDSTPFHTSKQANNDTARDKLEACGNVGPSSALVRGSLLRGSSNMGVVPGHRRTQSLPPNTHQPARLPQHKALTMIFANPSCKTYRFHSGLAGDINVQEVMAESKLSFTFPQQLLSLWICEEKELVHEIAGLGELKSPWHKCQMTWLENHLNIINTYSQALENLDGKKILGRMFRKSTEKGDSTFEFVPTNLHIQRIWVENESLRKSGFFDTFTHGAFTAFAHKSPGLIKMLKELKSPQAGSAAWCSQSDRLQMAEDTLSAVRRVRREVVDNMRVLMKKGKDRQSDGMFALVEEMMKKTKCLCSLLDQSMVEEVFAFLEENKITQRPEKDEFSESVAEFMQRNKLKIDLPLFRPNKFDSLQTPCTEFVSKELQTPEVDIYSPLDPEMSEFWRSYSAYTSGYQSVDRLSDIDEFEESFKYMSVIDKTRQYYTLCRTGSPIDTPVATPELTPKRLLKGAAEVAAAEVGDGKKEEECDEGFEGEEVLQVQQKEEKKTTEEKEEETVEKVERNEEVILANNKEDGSSDNPPEKTKEEDDNHGLTSESVNDVLHYRAGDEPEPIDLTHLNIEAAMMCLASKVRMLCGKANSPTLCSRTFRFRELDAQRNSSGMPKSASHESTFKIPDVPNPTLQGEEEVAGRDWSAELRPSMRKLRQGMDSLCKTSRLVCSVLRLQQLTDAVNLSHDIKYRRDVCFSQALTTLVTSLMSRFWATDPDPAFLQLCAQLGPLACFESLLSLHGEDVAIFNDMLVAVEDLRNVSFTLILVDKRAKAKTKAMAKTKTRKGGGGGLPILHYHTFPLPRVTGSRSCLKVMLPVPDYVYTMLPLEQIKVMAFSVTPILFNVGINEMATIAGRFGNNVPQEKNNMDNFKIISEYHRRFRRLELPIVGVQGNGRNKRNAVYSNEPQIDDLLAILKNEVNNRKNKNVDILHLASQISRRMSGLRFSCCKSGKDRTGMAVTLEQVQILSREFDLAEHEYQKAIDVMRSEGTRRDNVFKNIDDRRYAFNTLQLATFPYQYRPPVGTFGSSVT